MYFSRQLDVPRIASLLVVLLLPAAGFSQTLSEGRGVSLSLDASKVDPQNSKSISVQIRDSSGSKLDKLVVVTLYKFSGQSVSAEATSNSQAIFGQLGAGAYFMDVEALG